MYSLNRGLEQDAIVLVPEQRRKSANPRRSQKGQTLHFALQEKQEPFSASDHHDVGHRAVWGIADTTADQNRRKVGMVPAACVRHDALRGLSCQPSWVA